MIVKSRIFRCRCCAGIIAVAACDVCLINDVIHRYMRTIDISGMKYKVKIKYIDP